MNTTLAPQPLAAPAPEITRSMSGTWAKPAILTLSAAVLLWTCWPTLVTFYQIWIGNPQYSHGFLVVPFAAFLLWHRRARLKFDGYERIWIGVTLLLAGCGLKLVGGHYAFAWPDRISILFLVAGVFGTLGGWPVLRWAWPALGFLVFMVPMPGRAETLLSGPLQRVATNASANVLQTLGFFAQPDGTVIILSEADLGIVEACSGLRMLLAFVALSVALAIVIERPSWQRWALVAGAIPIALICNIARIVVTAIVLETAGRKWADLVFHDLAGWLMMPAGLALLWLELAFLRRVILPADVALPLPTVSSRNSPASARVQKR